ncbi:hypothetical protein [Yersinia mollaretii]|uniref:hypothetical protein n=1 Tax=Yersinia mollaretii TaxID=33060 RepID=UPI0005E081EF|nr:hypothetical protein [Yersinia mollaretii]CNF01286.1 Uncharacterised protein [Yersinia mollaretii]
MDIFQVLEAIKPQDHVLTVQVNAAKDIYDWLIVLSPTLVAIVALWYSARQFRMSMRTQIAQIKLNARLETEVKQRQEWCNSVRMACTKYASISHEKHMKNVESKIYKEDPERMRIIRSDLDRIHLGVIESRGVLMTLLSPKEHKDFYSLMREFNKHSDSEVIDSSKFGDCLVRFYGLCRDLIEKEQQSIVNIHKETDF